MKLLRRISSILNQFALVVAGLCLCLMMMLTCTNIILRVFFKQPIRGTYELMGLLGAVVTALALGITQSRKENISVDIVVSQFPSAMQRFLRILNSLVCMAFFCVATWQVAKYATTLMQTGEVTETLRMAYYPFTYVVSAGCACLALVFLVDFIGSIAEFKGGPS